MQGIWLTLLDPVTNKLVAFLVSEHTDLELALATLRQSDLHHVSAVDFIILTRGQFIPVWRIPAGSKQKRLHTIDVQTRNCQDNAPQESFFGHFKDEVRIRNAKDIELREPCRAICRVLQL